MTDQPAWFWYLTGMMMGAAITAIAMSYEQWRKERDDRRK